MASSSPWAPPIPGGKLTSKPVRNLGSAVTFLHWCYEAVNRDGTIEFQIHEVAGDLDESYYTVRKWWAAVKGGPWFSEVVDRGRLGFRIHMADDWLEWRGGVKSPSSNGEVPKQVLEDDEGPIQMPVNARSSASEVPTAVLENSGNKVLMSDQESESTRERENHDNAVGSHSLSNGTSEPKHLDPLALAIAETCRINPKIATDKQRQQLNEAYKALKAIGVRPEDIPLRVAWWEQNDWRAQKEPGRPITPKELQDVWEKVTTPPRSPPKANAPPTDNRPPLPAFQPQSRGPTNGAKLTNAVNEVFGRLKNNDDTS